jgi:hypothetical protein
VTELPPEIERLLLDVVADGFTVYCCGPWTAPTALAASYEWPNCVDHLTIRSWDQAAAARIPKLGEVNVFEPEVVVWSYEGCAEPTMRAVLSLVHPQHPEAPAAPYPAPRSVQLPRHEQRPMRIRMPSANQARTRAARLTGLWRAQLDRSVYQLATSE